MLEMSIDKLEIRGDRLLVKQLRYEEKMGSFFVPESVRDRKAKRRGDAWRAEVLKIGDKVDFTELRGTLESGDIVFVAPVAIDCPAFEGTNGDKLIVITQDDVLAKEIK